MKYLDTVMELVIGFMALFIITKMIGKRQISQITPFDFISAIVLGELLGNAIYDKEIGLLYIISTLLLWGVLMVLVELITQKFRKTRGFLEGNPSIVIRQGLIDRKELNKNKIDINELLNMLRQKDVFSVREVEYGILEADGKMSVLKKSKYTQPTIEDLGLTKKPSYLPFALIIDGEIVLDNLKNSGFDEKWLQIQLNNQGFDRAKDIFYAEWKQDEGMHIVPMKEKA
ncbi:DUF421 domain-containing protein [Maledivibacter halophilus]|uniref:Uncharacterized membrane protein YcaP, DUF421 family n=1 Tax=Maledivibacter halophilus TaxID=36842 RepID=A0A1T5M0C6_9FIRM|nr:DUF421 domain-containing protein [Maledivibacter halophilus]SKC81672.1 Uncharacterized membrane protein YcaP, DUF421 family [Maledivibacter halophilus]